MLGTLVEVGTLVEAGAREGTEAAVAAAFQAMTEAFQAVAQVERLMSFHLPDSDIGRFNSAPAGTVLPIHPWTARVLSVARELEGATEGLFDVAQGTGRWELLDGRIEKRDGGTRLNLGGIAKGEAVDRALEALLAAGAPSGWVNAGGDLRVAGMDLPVGLRDERTGGVRPWATLQDGAMATSHFPLDDPHRLCGRPAARHVTVAAPRCAVADALTKVVALTGMTAGTLLDRFEAQAWIHE